MQDLRAGRFSPFADVLMLRLDIFAADGPVAGGPATDNPAAEVVHYVTPFVTDGTKLYLFEEPGDSSDEFDALLLDRVVNVSSSSTGELVVEGRGQRPTPDEEAWARDACSARFYYDQALQDLAQLGTIVAIS